MDAAIPTLRSARRGAAAERPVPLALRNLLASPGRLARSAIGIAFAVLLMMVELGFRGGFIESMLLPIRQLDGEIVLLSPAKYQFDRPAPFPRRQLYEARSVAGVAWARPLYAARLGTIWKNPQNNKSFMVLVFAFNPDRPVFKLPAIEAAAAQLRQLDTVLVDQRSRSFLGTAAVGTETELAHHRVQVVGTFRLGPNFFNDGMVMMSDRTFLNLFNAGPPDPGRLADTAPEPADVDIGVVKVQPGHSVAAIRQALRAALPADVDVLTKSELLAREAAFHLAVSPVGPVFDTGTLFGFAVGMLIAYQTLFSDLSDQLPSYATMKAMGYTGAYLLRVVLEQAALYAAAGYIPAWILCALLFRALAEIALLPMHMSLTLTLSSVVLTLGMCLAAALVAARRVFSANPAELF